MVLGTWRQGESPVVQIQIPWEEPCLGGQLCRAFPAQVEERKGDPAAAPAKRQAGWARCPREALALACVWMRWGGVPGR